MHFQIHLHSVDLMQVLFQGEIVLSNIVPQSLSRLEIEKLIPHKGKMLLVTRVKNHNSREHTISTEFDVTQDCIFYSEKISGIPSWSVFEIMAQGISVLASIERIESNNSSCFNFRFISFTNSSKLFQGLFFASSFVVLFSHFYLPFFAPNFSPNLSQVFPDFVPTLKFQGKILKFECF